YEDRVGENVDNRLRFYRENQLEIPSVTGDVVPDYVSSFSQYREKVIGRYSMELAAAGADKILLNKEWVNSRGVIFRFDRRALEIRVMDEQECVKSDVALSCFTRALLRGLMKEENTDLLPHDLLVNDFNMIVAGGLKATIQHPQGRTAKQVCQHYLRIASKNATGEEKKYLPIMEKRIERGNLSEIISEDVRRRSQKTELHEAIVDVYQRLMKSLINNQPHF
ncbi:glutamate-cysteine ligase family protein, partial [Candidatus Bathyarchaeota archaeon]|nr:glutamate-cysteine ligase family protein [Candidatus Bathyarchaeota archaeon]